MNKAIALLSAAFLLGACKPAPAPPQESAVDAANRKLDWPPRIGEPYPDPELVDPDGKIVRLSSFKGKVLLIEPIGMNCPACIRLAGAAKPGIGPFEGHAPEKGEHSAEDYFSWFEVDGESEQLVVVHLLLYNLAMQGPTAADAKRWREHFKVTGKNRFVLAGGPGLINQGSYDMIPGFQLVDKDFILRHSAAGHRPIDSTETLLTATARLLR